MSQDASDVSYSNGLKIPTQMVLWGGCFSPGILTRVGYMETLNLTFLENILTDRQC